MSSREADALPGVRTIVRRMPWVLSATLIGGAGGLFAQLGQPVMYESTAFVSVSAEDGASTDALASARASQAIARIATAPSIVSSSLKEAGLDSEAEQPRISVSSRAAPDAPLISISGTATSPVRAQRIAQVTVQALEDLPAVGAYRTVVVAPPNRPEVSLTPTWLVPIGSAAVAFIGSMVVAVVVRPGEWR